jgi:hypothetical protein
MERPLTFRNKTDNFSQTQIGPSKIGTECRHALTRSDRPRGMRPLSKKRITKRVVVWDIVLQAHFTIAYSCPYRMYSGSGFRSTFPTKGRPGSLGGRFLFPWVLTSAAKSSHCCCNKYKNTQNVQM